MFLSIFQTVVGHIGGVLLAPVIKWVPALAAWHSRHPVVMGVYLLNIAANAIEQEGPNRLAKKLYQQLPPSWTGANGPATEEELIHVIRLAVRLVKALQALTNR